MGTHNICFEGNIEKSKNKSTENCYFTVVKNRCILHGHVFVMKVLTLIFTEMIYLNALYIFQAPE